MAGLRGVPINERGGPTEVFGSLTIERRVLLTPARTISIPNIAAISVGAFPIKPSPAWLLGAALCAIGAAGAYGALQMGAGGSVALAFIVLIIAAIALLAKWFLSPRATSPYLIVTTNDGTRTLFTGHTSDTLEKVRRILSDKINADDEAATYNINFEKGTIESLNVGEVAKLETAAIVNGSNNQVAAASAGARIGTADTSYTANSSPGAQFTTHEATYAAHNSPGAQLGHGHAAASTIAHDISHNISHIDYSSVLAQVEQMQRFYSQQPQARHVEERLSELELLMRSGTPTQDGRSRVRQLAVDLGTILQGYPAMVQFFQGIVRLVGG